jgi:hypothetical protein
VGGKWVELAQSRVDGGLSTNLACQNIIVSLTVIALSVRKPIGISVCTVGDV